MIWVPLYAIYYTINGVLFNSSGTMTEVSIPNYFAIRWIIRSLRPSILLILCSFITEIIANIKKRN